MITDLPPTLSRSFSMADQERFARLSGDENPMHMDPMAARRTPAGHPVVHGVHTILAGMQVALAAHPGFVPRSLRVRFQKPILVDDPVEFFVQARASGTLVVRAMVEGTLRTSIEIGDKLLSLAPPQGSPAKAAEPDWNPERGLVVRDLGDLDGMHGGFAAVAAADGSKRAGPGDFPLLAERLPAGALAGIAALSCLVGMVCPGLHSIFSAIDANFDGPAGERVAYRVTALDDRFRKLTQWVSGCGITASVEAFVRHPPVEQPTSAALAALVVPGEFSRCHALVIGGSRGLGSVAAKLIAAGGGAVTITYSVGAAEAQEVVADIRSHGGTAQALAFDVRQDATAIAALSPAPTELHYYATPKIGGARGSAAIDAGKLDQYLDFYVHRFAAICEALAGKRLTPLLVCYPSSIAVVGAPPDFAEYAMAKAAGEVLCDHLAKKLKMRIVRPRLPRILTDQTASLSPVTSEAPGPLLIEILREMHAPLEAGGRA